MIALGMKVSEALDNLQNGQIVLLENLRFHAGETENDQSFAESLAAMLMLL